jgi:molybdopterin synthase sulfur carrier subunit
VSATTGIIVRVPAQLRTLTGGAREVAVPAGTVGDVIGSLEAVHPGMRERLLDEDGTLRRFVNVFVADEDVRFLQGLGTPVEDGQTISIVPAVAGGCVGIAEMVSC